MTPRSVKTHHVVDLLHVDAFQWECVALLFRDPVALPKHTQAMSHSRIVQENNAATVKLAGSYVADIAGWRTSALRSFWQDSIFIRIQLVPLFLPKAFVYRHNVALCSKDVLVIRPVQRVVLIKQLQLEKGMRDCNTMFLKNVC